jgi:hypothetical protein
MTDRMDAVDHTHPAQDAVTGAYRRGRETLLADGAGEESDAEADPEPSRMRDVSHASADGTNGVWARGETEQPVRDDDE